jgi:hypothetical protein
MIVEPGTLTRARLRRPYEGAIAPLSLTLPTGINPQLFRLRAFRVLRCSGDPEVTACAAARGAQCARGAQWRRTGRSSVTPLGAGRQVLPGRMMETASTATSTTPRPSQGVNPGPCLRLNKASAIRLPPGSMSAIAAYGPSSRNELARRLLPSAGVATVFAIPALRFDQRLARSAAFFAPRTNRRPRSLKVSSALLIPVGQGSRIWSRNYGDSVDHLESRRWLANAGPSDMARPISKVSDCHGPVGVLPLPPETYCVPGALLVSCGSSSNPSSKRANHRVR